MIKRLLILFLFFIADIPFVRGNTGINAAIGDESFYKTFGTSPLPGCPGKLRVQTHLAYVEQLLRAAPVNHLDAEQQKHRSLLLDQLHRYTIAGAFPENKKFPGEHRPCFIDARRNICAVGYLIEQSAGRALAEKINADFQYAYLGEITVPELEAWIRWSGLSAAECAMIQPAYGGTEYARVVIGNDSLVSRIRKIDFRSPSDSCTLQFTITHRGNFRHAKTISGDRRAGKKIIRTLRREKYVAAMSWSMSGSLQHYRRFLGIRCRTKDARFSSVVRLSCIFAPEAPQDTFLKNNPPEKLNESREISGIITDAATREPMPFVTVLIINPLNQQVIAGASSDFDGRYKIKIPAGTDLPAQVGLEAKMIGYAKKTVLVSSRKTAVMHLNLEMREGTNCTALDCIGVIYISR
ncbi:MAG: hypothetical protein FD123_2869 [Bacteroidetes bacterium]|nr:MAG: hypothetical protein FD123_2869 [Bacteroidota bacterium]